MGDDLDRAVVRGAFAIIVILIVGVLLRTWAVVSLINSGELTAGEAADVGSFMAVILALIGVITIIVKRPTP